MKAKSEKGLRSKKKILDAARKLISKNGVHGTSVDDVLKEAKAGKSQFYHYFASKDLMVQTLIAELGKNHEFFQTAKLDDIRTVDDFELWFDQLIQATENGALKWGCPVGTIGSELGAQSEGARESSEIVMMGWQTMMGEMFARLKTHKALPPSANPQELAAIVLIQIQGGLLLAKTTASVIHLQLAKSNVLRYLQSAPKRAGGYTKSTPEPRSPGSKPRPRRPGKNLGFCP